nr:hypothetical protein [Tanacetum cinerariifolium]
MAAPFANHERQFRARRDNLPPPMHNIYTFYESVSFESESKDVGEIDIETLTLKHYFTLNNTHRRIRSSIENAIEDIEKVLVEYGESLFPTWERYNDLLLKFPFHYLNDHQKVNTFYNGLKGQTRRIVDSNGLIHGLTASEALKSIQELVDHSHKWHNKESKNTATPFGIIVETLKALKHEMDELRVDVRKQRNEKPP